MDVITSKQYFLEKNRNREFPKYLNSPLWDVVEITGLDSQFMGAETIRSISNWNGRFVTTEVDDREIKMTFAVKEGAMNMVMMDIEQNYAPGTLYNLCLRFRTSAPSLPEDKSYLLTMPVVVSSSSYTTWDSQRMAEITFMAEEPFFSTYVDKPVETAAEGANVTLDTYTSVPAPWTATIKSSSTQEGILVSSIGKAIITIRSYDRTGKEIPDDLWKIYVDTSSMTLQQSIPFKIYLDGGNIFNSTIQDNPITKVMMLDLSTMPNTMEALRPAEGKIVISLELQDSAGARTKHAITSPVQARQYMRFVSVPVDGSVFVDSYVFDPRGACRPENIKIGKTIAGVKGTYTGDSMIPEISINPRAESIFHPLSYMEFQMSKMVRGLEYNINITATESTGLPDANRIRLDTVARHVNPKTKKSALPNAIILKGYINNRHPKGTILELHSDGVESETGITWGYNGDEPKQVPVLYLKTVSSSFFSGDVRIRADEPLSTMIMLSEDVTHDVEGNATPICEITIGTGGIDVSGIPYENFWDQIRTYRGWTVNPFVFIAHRLLMPGGKLYIHCKDPKELPWTPEQRADFTRHMKESHFELPNLKIPGEAGSPSYYRGIDVIWPE